MGRTTVAGSSAKLVPRAYAGRLGRPVPFGSVVEVAWIQPLAIKAQTINGAGLEGRERSGAFELFVKKRASPQDYSSQETVIECKMR